MNRIRIASIVLTCLALFTLGWAAYVVLFAFRSPAWFVLPAVLGATAVRGWWLLHALRALDTKIQAP
jgi:hypothetical protein